MICITGGLTGIVRTEVNVEHFPDGTQRIFDLIPECSDGTGVNLYTVHWKYEKEEEMATLWYVVHHLKDHEPLVPIALELLYIPNARMDRTHNNGEVFTMKYFADFINSLGFCRVNVLDPHSDVSTALIKNIHKYPVANLISKAVIYAKSVIETSGNPDKEIIYYFPDAGAMKRYCQEIPETAGVIYGEKDRDWNTGAIRGLKIVNPQGIDLKEKNIMMIDDIVAYGGTLSYSVIELKKQGCGMIFAYVTHVENSVDDPEKGVLNERLKEGTVTRLYTSQSLYSGKNEKITVIL